VRQHQERAISNHRARDAGGGPSTVTISDSSVNSVAKANGNLKNKKDLKIQDQRSKIEPPASAEAAIIFCGMQKQPE
jgi:hypothetical protein